MSKHNARLYAIEYIERETLLKRIVSLEQLARKRVYDTPTNSPCYERYVAQMQDRQQMLSIIKAVPAANVVEVRRSRIKWVNRPIAAQYATVTDEFGEKHYGKVHEIIEHNPVGYCEECGKRLDDTFMKFCPNCGAKMEG